MHGMNAHQSSIAAAAATIATILMTRIEW